MADLTPDQVQALRLRAQRLGGRDQAGVERVVGDVLDGRAVGTWTRLSRGINVEVVVNLFAPLSAGAYEALEEVAEDLGRFLGRRAKFTPGR
jgi:hypothetical protein